jgi:hypothetical protein
VVLDAGELLVVLDAGGVCLERIAYTLTPAAPAAKWRRPRRGHLNVAGVDLKVPMAIYHLDPCRGQVKKISPRAFPVESGRGP